MTEAIESTQPLETNLRILVLRNVCIGHIVTTSKGFSFQLVSRKDKKESWLDLTSKLTWHDREDLTYTHYKAVEKFGDNLPTIEEFKLAELHGFREILPNMQYWFWSASLYPYSSDFAQDFVGFNGFSYYGYRGYDYFSVRCVGR
jgi:hypothetical protein